LIKQNNGQTKVSYLFEQYCQLLLESPTRRIVTSGYWWNNAAVWLCVRQSWAWGMK
jgi:hypothetical protein